MHELLDYLNIKLTPQLQEKLEPIISEHHYKKGDKLFRPKEVDEQIFFIIKGGARSFYLKEGKEITYLFTFENDIMISMRSKLSKLEFPEIVEFIEDSHIISIHTDLISLPLKASNVSAVTFLNTILIRYTHFLEDRVITLQHKSARERYEWSINRYPRLFERATLSQIASFLGITTETLCRIRSGKYAT